MISNRISRVKTHFYNIGLIGQKLVKAGFVHISETKVSSIWMIPNTGRLLCFTKSTDLWLTISDNGGICLPITAEIIDVVHILNAEEHHLLENLI